MSLPTKSNLAKIFNNGDKPYFQWMKANPNGYVLNTGRTSNSSKFFLHSSNCTHIADYKKVDYKEYTTRELIKVAANDLNSIRQYCNNHKKKFKGEFEICKTCKPDVSVIEINYPDEIVDGSEVLKEGAKKQITVNAYERNSEAREKCIEYFGCKCQCCEMDFEEKFGEIGRGYIHVHHLIPLSNIQEEYEVNPIEDMIPLCPNCHAMIHRKKEKEPFRLDELREIIRSYRK